MKKYLAWDSVNGEHETFDTLKEAQDYLTECFLCDGEYHPDIENFCIYELHSRVSYDVVDSKDNYEYGNEEDIPDNDKISEAWPYDNEYDEIWKHKFIEFRDGSFLSEEEIREPIENALYATGSYTTDQCTEFSDGILTYLNEAGYKVVRK